MIKLKRVKEICSLFKKKRILIFGDIILDRYIFGKVNRISPEAPVPVVKIEKEEFRPGGAGNVAANIKKLGAKSILIGITGDDIYSNEIFKLKINNDSIIRSKKNKTLVKTRVISGRQQIVRIDREENIIVTPETEDKIIKEFENVEKDGIIISDYAKGTLTRNIIEYIKLSAKSNNIPIIVDPKPANYNIYKNIDGITPNQKEAEEIINKKIIDEKDAAAAVKFIRKKFKTKFVTITRGDKGISAGENGKKVFHIPTFCHEVFDVTGAGDTVVSTLMLSLISGANLREAVSLANAAASIVVEKIGTAQTTIDEIHKRIKFLSKNQ